MTTGVPYTRSPNRKPPNHRWVIFNVRAEHADAAERALQAFSQAPEGGPVDENAVAMAWNTVRAEGRKLSGGHHSLSDLLAAVEQYGDRRAALAAQPQLDLRDDVIESLRGQLADLQTLCDERGRRLYGDDIPTTTIPPDPEGMTRDAQRFGVAGRAAPAEGDERAAFEAWWSSKREGSLHRWDAEGREAPTHLVGIYLEDRTNQSWKVWQAAWKAALALKPQPKVTSEPVACGTCDCLAQCGDSAAYTAELAAQLGPMRSRATRFEQRDGGRWIDDDDFGFDATLKISGDFGSDAEREGYAQGICDKLNAPAPVQAPAPMDEIEELKAQNRAVAQLIIDNDRAGAVKWARGLFTSLDDMEVRAQAPERNERAAFEDWAIEQPRVAAEDACFERDYRSPERYANGTVQSLWLAWQAGAAQYPAVGAAQEPFAWAVLWGLLGKRRHSVHFERKSAEEAAAPIKSSSELLALYVTPPDHTAAMRQALGALNACAFYGRLEGIEKRGAEAAASALRAALGEPQPPVHAHGRRQWLS